MRETLERKLAQLKARSAGLPVRCMADVPAESVAWLWAPYIPKRKLTILEGDPGVGKSWIVARIARDVSRGDVPGGGGRAGGVLILTAEDGLSDTLRPRLDSMGADPTRIIAFSEALDFTVPGTLDAVRETIAEHRPALVTIDPIVAYVGGKLDLHRANEVRSVLAPLARIAEDSDTAILLVRHLSKARAGRALHAGLGSVDFSAAARSVLLAGSAGDASERRAIVHVKSNLARAGASLEYVIGERGLEWTGASSLRAADLLGGEGAPDENSEREDATDFIEHFLANGERSAAEVVAASSGEGISRRTLYRAANKAGVEKRRLERFGAGSVWSLRPKPDVSPVPPAGGGTKERQERARPNPGKGRPVRAAFRATEATPLVPREESRTNAGAPEIIIHSVRATNCALARGTEGEPTADTVRV